jgi:RNA polymerase primary sigma factor
MKQLRITKEFTIRNTSLDKYFAEVSKIPGISVEEEVELTHRRDNGDPEAVKELARANLRFVISVAKQYQNQGLPLPDLINEGNLGLMKAAEKFDATRGFKFISCAVWRIRSSILQALSKVSTPIHIPENIRSKLRHLKARSDQFEQQH